MQIILAFVKFLPYYIYMAYIYYEVNLMGVSYKKLFKLLIDRDLRKKDLQEMTGLSSATITKMAKNENVNIEVVVKVCEALHVDVGDIMEVEHK